MDWVSVLSVLGAAISGGGIYKIVDIVLNRRKAAIEVNSSQADCFKKELENTLTLVQFWRDASQQLASEVKEVNQMMEALILERDKLRINLSIVKSIIQESTCETLEDVKNKIEKL
jgi:ABC-type phosphate transport system auxiliary subunit